MPPDPTGFVTGLEVLATNDRGVVVELDRELLSYSLADGQELARAPIQIEEHPLTQDYGYWPVTSDGRLYSDHHGQLVVRRIEDLTLLGRSDVFPADIGTADDWWIERERLGAATGVILVDTTVSPEFQDPEKDRFLSAFR